MSRFPVCRCSGLAVALVLAACGQRTPGSSFAPDLDANAGDVGVPPPADAPFPCGPPGTSLMCDPAQFCVVGCTDEGPVVCSPLADGGSCPPGSALSPDCSPVEAGAPCAEDPGPTYPTVCVDSLEPPPCPGAGVDPLAPSHTVSCACTL